jgi:hypothetical protein
MISPSILLEGIIVEKSKYLCLRKAIKLVFTLIFKKTLQSNYVEQKGGSLLKIMGCKPPFLDTLHTIRSPVTSKPRTKFT